MKLTPKANELMKRYLLAVERRLPLQGRKDLIQEIESDLMDRIEDQLRDAAPQSMDEHQLEAQLRLIGSPAEVANTFAPAQPLIAPQHDFIFRIIVTIVVPIVMGAIFLAGVVSLAFSGGANPLQSIFSTLSAMWSAAIGIIGTAAIVFMVLTRFFPDVNQKADAIKVEFETEQKPWVVGDLPELPLDEEKLYLWEPLVGVILGTFFLAILVSLFNRYAGLWFINVPPGDWVMLDVLTEDVKAMVPWWALSIALGIGHDGLLLYQRRRSLLSRWYEIGTKIVDIIILGMFISIPQYVNFDSADALAQGMPANAVQGFETLFGFQQYFRYVLMFALAVVAITLVVDVVKTLLRTIKASETI
jgi:hypothetical protein